MVLHLKPDYGSLALLSGLLGAFFALLAAPGLAAPRAAAPVFRRFPRSRVPGCVLAAVAIVWSFLWLAVMPLGSVSDFLRPWLQVLLPVSVAAVCLFLPDLLACRAAGGLMLLVPAPLFSAAQWHPSPWRLVVVVVGYAMAVAGMFVVAKPWLLRDAISWTTAGDRRFRAVSGAFLAAGLLLLALAFFAFPGAAAPLR